MSISLRQHKRRAAAGMARRLAVIHTTIRRYPVFDGCTPTIGWWVMRQDWNRNRRGEWPIRMGVQPGFRYSNAALPAL